MVMACVSCCLFSSDYTGLLRRLEQSTGEGHENNSKQCDYANDDLGIRSVIPCVFRHHYPLAMDYYWDRYRSNTFSSPSSGQNRSYAHIFILWSVAPYWKKPRILSPAFSHHIPFLYDPVRADYLSQAWRINARLGCISVLWRMPCCLLCSS